MMFVADRTASKYSPSVANLILTFSSGCEFICKGGGEMMSAAGSGRESACARVCVRVRVCLFICVSVHFCVCLRVSVCVCACLHTRRRASLGSSTCPPPPFPSWPYVFDQPLVVSNLRVNLVLVVVSEVVTQGHENVVRCVELRLLAVLVQQHPCPLRNIRRRNLLRGNAPGARVAPAGQPRKVKLAAHLWRWGEERSGGEGGSAGECSPGS